MNTYLPNSELLGRTETVSEIAENMTPDQRAQFLQRIKALDTLLTLFGLKRQENVYAGGFLIYHESRRSIARWVELDSTEESWLEDVKRLTPSL